VVPKSGRGDHQQLNQNRAEEAALQDGVLGAVPRSVVGLKEDRAEGASGKELLTVPEGKQVGMVVKLPPRLRELADGAREVRVSAETVGEALEAVVQRYPGMRSRLRTTAGELRSSVLFFLNTEDIRARQGEATPLAAGDELVIAPVAEGG